MRIGNDSYVLARFLLGPRGCVELRGASELHDQTANESQYFLIYLAVSDDSMPLKPFAHDSGVALTPVRLELCFGHRFFAREEDGDFDETCLCGHGAGFALLTISDRLDINGSSIQGLGNVIHNDRALVVMIQAHANLTQRS